MLHKALIDSNLGENVIGGGLSSDLLHDTFSIGLKGIKSGSSSCANQSSDCNADNNSNTSSCITHSVEYKLTMVEDIVFSTLKSLAKNGFDNKAIQASMNITEFNLREFNTGTFALYVLYNFVQLS